MPASYDYGIIERKDRGEVNRMKWLLLLFIIIPAVEIGVFIVAGQTIGGFATVALIIATGILGAYLAKRQGLEVWKRVQDQISHGIPPGDALLEGLCVLAGGIMLLSPGFITDLAGLFLLLPPTRKLCKPILYKLFKQWASRRQIFIYR